MSSGDDDEAATFFTKLFAVSLSSKGSITCSEEIERNHCQLHLYWIAPSVLPRGPVTTTGNLN